MRLVIANSALRASLAIYHLITRADGIIVKYCAILLLDICNVKIIIKCRALNLKNYHTKLNLKHKLYHRFICPLNRSFSFQTCVLENQFNKTLG